MDCKNCGRCQRCLARLWRETVERNKTREKKLTLSYLNLDTGRPEPLANQPHGVLYVEVDGVTFTIVRREDVEGIEVSVSGMGSSRKSLMSVRPRAGNVVQLVAIEP